jgi:hypothetical protein
MSWRRMGEWRYKYSSTTIDFSTRWEWPASRTGRFIPQKTSGAQRVRGSMAFRTGTEAVEKRTFSCQEQNTGSPARSPSLHRLSYSGSAMKRTKITKFQRIASSRIYFIFYSLSANAPLGGNKMGRTDRQTDRWTDPYSAVMYMDFVVSIGKAAFRNRGVCKRA